LVAVRRSRLIGCLWSEGRWLPQSNCLSSPLVSLCPLSSLLILTFSAFSTHSFVPCVLARCPAFKLLTYYGGVKERAAKRQGWSKPNAFHVCITSYTLVLQVGVVLSGGNWVIGWRMVKFG
jgi:hypothetical protein